jgi:serine/threonine protein kinase
MTSDHHQDDTPTQPSRPGLGSSDLLKRAFGHVARGDEAEATPERIGPYRVLGRVGRGGMGSVYKATDEREASGRRLVAIKLVRKGLDTEDVLRRFKLEGQLLAALNHPNIARLYEVAETEDGRPYFVMEYVEGKPVTAYCDDKRASIKERLAIFRKVCQAVHHAHANLIVHRDLKPGNILVTPEGEPKLLDFGIAKLLNPNLGRVEVLTRPTMRIMTPEYASPEQVRGEPVSTRSDVYSLGVLLYELLSGRRPYRFAERIEAEVVRIICESEPVRPSTAVTSVSAEEASEEAETPRNPRTAATIAQSRAAERVETLRRTLSGDLDDIVMMALEKSPDRRYASADRFSEDLGRYLSGLPVEARRTGSRRLYQMRKFLKRRRTEVAAAAAVMLALLIGGGVAAGQWRAASIANERAAIAAEAEADALAERLEAVEELAAASAYGDALWRRANEHLNFSMTPGERDAFWSGVREDFDALAQGQDASNPQARFARARALLQVGHVLGGTRAGNRGEFVEALAAYEAARDDLVALHEDRPNEEALWVDAVEAQLRVGDALRRMNRLRDAVAAYERAIELGDAGDFPGGGLRVERQQSKPRMALGQTAVLLGDANLAADVFDREISERRARLDRYPDELIPLRDLAIVLLSAGELSLETGDAEAARARLEEMAQLQRELLAARPGHPSLRRDLAGGLIALSLLEARLGRADAAADQLEDAMNRLSELAEEAPDDARIGLTAARGLIEHATASLDAGEVEGAASSVERARMELDRLEALAPLHPSLSPMRARLRLLEGQLALNEGEVERAAEHLEMARDQLASIVALEGGSVSDRLRLGDALVALGESRRRLQGSEDAARPLFVEARRIYESCGEPDGAFGPHPERWALVERYTPETADARGSM